MAASTVRTAFGYFTKRQASPVGGAADDAAAVASAPDTATAYNRANAYLDQWLGQRSSTSAPSPSPSPTPSAPAKNDAPAGRGPLLRTGSGGDAVKKLQARLKQLGFDPGPLDGDFGPQTVAAVRKFQADRGIRVDGIVGPETWGKLNIVVDTPDAASSAAPAQGGVVNTPDGQMVRRDGHMISVRIADGFDRMVAAAKRDGIDLRIESAYRGYQEQVVLWNRYGRNPARVARPGTSNHQSGCAIDFQNTSGAWAWLKRNADQYGLHNYPAEAWHYSIDGH